jgi:hypothetical protein
MRCRIALLSLSLFTACQMVWNNSVLDDIRTELRTSNELRVTNKEQIAKITIATERLASVQSQRTILLDQMRGKVDLIYKIFTEDGKLPEAAELPTFESIDKPK